MQQSVKRTGRPRELLLPKPGVSRPLSGVSDLGVGESAAAYTVALARRRPSQPARKEGHSLAWLAWGGGGLLTLWLTSNPLYLTIIMLAAIVVFLACARIDALESLFKPLLWLGALIFALQLLFSVVTAGQLPGETQLVHLPEVTLPPLLGGITLGGRITAEQLVWGVVRGLRLWGLLLLLGAFNASVNHYRLIRRVPAFLFHVALVTTIALALVPQTVLRLRAIREAQRLRGYRFRHWRDVLPLLTPLIAGGLERSLTLAEAMESRGYGRTVGRQADKQSSVRDQLLSMTSALLLILGAYGIFYSSTLRPMGLLLILFGTLILVSYLRRLGRQVKRTYYNREQWTHADIALGLVALSIPLILVLLDRVGIQLDYPIFPQLAAPDFHPAAGLCLLLLATPALLRPASKTWNSRQGTKK